MPEAGAIHLICFGAALSFVMSPLSYDRRPNADIGDVRFDLGEVGGAHEDRIVRAYRLAFKRS